MKRKFICSLTCAMFLLSACGSAASEEKTSEIVPSVSTEAVTEAVSEESTEAPKAEFPEKGKELLNNDQVVITLEDWVEEDNYVGYSAIIENKTADKYLSINIEQSSVNGFMTSMHTEGTTVAPGKKSKAVFGVYKKDAGVDSPEELKNVEGVITIFSNTDGGNSYTGSDENYPFSISEDTDSSSAISETELAGTSSAVSETDVADSSSATTEQNAADASSTVSELDAGQILLDNELAKITLGEPLKDTETYYVGYAVTIENKTENKYILAGIDNGSVDGFMTNLSFQSGSVAPKKKLNTELRISKEDVGIEALEEIGTIEGSFTISTNTDGGNSYRGNSARYNFSISNVEKETAQETEGNTEADTKADAAEGETTGEEV